MAGDRRAATTRSPVPQDRLMSVENSIFFYDGDCGFCDSTVQFLLRHSAPERLSFCPLQSEYARDFFNHQALPQPDLTTAYYWKDGRLYSKSSAVLFALTCCRKPVSFLGLLFIIPEIPRDAVYEFVARNRRRTSSKSGCRILSAQDRQRFL